MAIRGELFENLQGAGKNAVKLFFSVIAAAVLGGLAGACLYMFAALLSAGEHDGQGILDFLMLVVVGLLVGTAGATAKRLAEWRYARSAGAVAFLTGSVLVLAPLAWVLPEYPERILAVWSLWPLLSGGGLLAYAVHLFLRGNNDARPGRSV